MGKKILILANSSGGLWSFRKELIMKLNESNDVYIATRVTKYKEELQEISKSVIEIPMERRGKNPFKDILIIKKYNEIIEEIKPDLVITYTIKSNIYGGISSSVKKVPFISNVTGLGSSFQKDNILKKLIVMLYKISFKKANLVFFENEENKNAFVKLGIIEEKRVHVLNGAGVNLQKFNIEEFKENEIFKFLFIGRMMKEKGIDELIEATKKIYNENEKVELNIIGPSEENYSNQIKQGEKEGWLKYHGYQNDVRSFIAESDCGILPSWHEGMANVNLECAAMGRPLITSNIAGCKEAVIEGKTGFLFEVKNKEHLYEVMKKMMSLSKNERKKMGMNGRIYIEKQFDKKKVVEDTYKKIIEKSSVNRGVVSDE